MSHFGDIPEWIKNAPPIIYRDWKAGAENSVEYDLSTFRSKTCETTGDVIFQTNDGGIVKAHKCIVCCRSIVLNEIIHGGVEIEEVDLRDSKVTTEDMEAFLDYLYGGFQFISPELQTKVLNACRPTACFQPSGHFFGANPQSAMAKWSPVGLLPLPMALTSAPALVFHLLTHDLTRMWLDAERTGDIVFQTADRERVKAHKCVICSRSIRFERMIYGEWKEGLTGEINLSESGITIGQLRAFISFLYNDTFCLHDALDLADLANQYEVPLLHRRAQSVLVEKCLDVDNVVVLLQFVDEKAEAFLILETGAIAFAARNMKQVNDANSEWTSRLSPEMLLKISNAALGCVTVDNVEVLLQFVDVRPGAFPELESEAIAFAAKNMWYLNLKRQVNNSVGEWASQFSPEMQVGIANAVFALCVIVDPPRDYDLPRDSDSESEYIVLDY